MCFDAVGKTSGVTPNLKHFAATILKVYSKRTYFNLPAFQFTLLLLIYRILSVQSVSWY